MDADENSESKELISELQSLKPNEGWGPSWKPIHSDGLARTIAEHRETDMKPLAKTVVIMRPIGAGYAVTRWKIAGAFALGTSIITALGWIVSLFAGKLIAWLLSFFR